MKIFNTMTRKKEEFVPVNPGKVGMYVCGITVYGLCHIGNARSAVVFDLLSRYLRFKDLDVTFIRNFTDVDDKIINRAKEENTTWDKVAEQYIHEFAVDMGALNVRTADVEPKCTEHIPEMVQLTADLIDKGHAYATASGDVYFKVRSFKDYGKLSGRNIDDMQSGARIQPGEEKQDPLDFALWKSSKPGEPAWDSPWGPGRPGWHLECSAMSEKYVPLPLDIHGGGQDLTFPHHENEIAQTEAARGEEFAKYWVHNGFVQINSEKMSKSLGNFFTVRDIMEKYLPEPLRYFLISVHYRSPLDFSWENLDEAEKAVRRVYSAIAQMRQELERKKWSKAQLPEEILKEAEDLEAGFVAALEDDLNTAGALGNLFGLVRLAGRVAENKSWRKSEGARELWTRILDDLDKWSEVLGVFQRDPQEFLAELRDSKAARKGIDPDKVQELMDKRAEARKAKDFEASDAIRDELAAMGVEVKDTPQGAVWDVE